MTHICILGGGFGGFYTALYLSNFAWVKSGKCKITLVDPKEKFLFHPLLYELITEELQPWEIAPSYQKLLRKTKINFCQQRVQEVDLNNRRFTLENGEELTYDYLVLAVGCKTRWSGVLGAKNHALTFRSLADVERLKAKLKLLETSARQRLRLAVIGAGPSGVELACKLTDYFQGRAQVYLIDRGKEILKNLAAGIKQATHRALQKRRVKVSLETSVKGIEADQITLLKDDQVTTIPVDLVIWAAGMQPLDWVLNLNCRKNNQGQLLTRSSLQLVDYPEVFALGDMAEIRNSNKLVPSTAQAAYQQASFAAKNIKAILMGKSLRTFRYLHLGDMLTLGQGAAVVSSFLLTIEGRLGATIRRLVYSQRLPTLRHRLKVLKHIFVTWIVQALRYLGCKLKLR